MSTSAGPRIAVIGAGIGGLTAAIALRAQGLEVDIYEQATALREVGAGISIGGNGTRILDGLGMHDALRDIAAVPPRIQFHHWGTGDIFYEHPMAGYYADRYGAPFLTVHRADLAGVLLEHCDVKPTLGKKVAGIREDPDGVLLEFADGTTAAADVVVGADGLRSTVRQHLAGDDEAVFSAMSCFRGLVPVEKVPGGDTMGLTFFLGPGRHIVAYPVRRGELINFIAYVPDPVWTLESWSAKGDAAEAVAAFDGWNDTVTAMLGAVEETGRWALYDREPLRTWSTERITVLGDAAHPMLPHAGQGTNQAIEDAYVLSHFFAQPEFSTSEALHAYEAVRKPRCRQMQSGSRGNAVCFQLPDGPEADKRNAGLQNLPDTVEWIHGYNVVASLTSTAPEASGSS